MAPVAAHIRNSGTKVYFYGTVLTLYGTNKNREPSGTEKRSNRILTRISGVADGEGASGWRSGLYRF